MIPGVDDFALTAGDTFVRHFTIAGLADVHAGFAGLTDANFSAVLERVHGGDVAARVPLTVAVAAGAGPDEWQVDVSLTDEETAALPARRMAWSLRVTDLPGDAADVSHTILEGAVTVLRATHQQAA